MGERGCTGLPIDFRASRTRLHWRSALTEGAHCVQVGMLLEEMERLGSRNADGKLVCKFGALIKDDRCSNIFEAIVGTLRSAKKKGILTFEGQMLLSPTHDDVDIIVK